MDRGSGGARRLRKTPSLAARPKEMEWEEGLRHQTTIQRHRVRRCEQGKDMAQSLGDLFMLKNRRHEKRGQRVVGGARQAEGL